MNTQKTGKRRTGAANAGGVAAQAGPDYQNRVGAWIAVQILAEQAAVVSWHLPEGTALEWVGAESAEPMDDLEVGTSRTWSIPIQVKHRLSADSGKGQGDGKGAALASAIEQCVRQHLKDPASSRHHHLLVVSGPRSTKQIKVDLPLLLNRLRAPGTYASILDAALGDKRHERTLGVVIEHAKQSWQTETGRQPDEPELAAFLARLRFEELDVDEDGRDAREAKRVLARDVLRDPRDADAAWNLLIDALRTLAVQRARADRAVLRRILSDAGKDLKISLGFDQDVANLRGYTQRTRRLLARRAEIRVGAEVVKLRRLTTEAVRAAAEVGHVAVVGEAGAGKTGTLHDLAVALEEEGRDVLLIAADKVIAEAARSSARTCRSSTIC